MKSGTPLLAYIALAAFTMPFAQPSLAQSRAAEARELSSGTPVASSGAVTIGGPRTAQAAMPSENANETVKMPLADDPLVEEAQDRRQRELIARRPGVTAIRLDPAGHPLVQMNLYFGGAVPEDEAKLHEIVDQFDFDENDGSSREGNPHGRTLFFFGRYKTPATSDLVFFDPEADLAIGMSRIANPQALNCSGYLAVNYNATLKTGASVSFAHWNAPYMMSDMIVAAVGPDKGTLTDTNLYLRYWNGSVWVLLASSTDPTHIDTVSGFNLSCLTVNWRVQVKMNKGGPFRLRVYTFRAS